MANNPPELSPKHRQALQLIEEGSMSVKEIAKKVGWSEQMLYALQEGNTQKVGSVGELFVAELNKIQSRNASKVRYLLKENKKLTLRKLNERLREIQPLPSSPELSRELAMILNAISKTTPSVEVSQTSYTAHMSVEELAMEFKRINALTEEGMNQQIPP